MITEADTCRKYLLPKLYAGGWNDDQINEQKSFTDGRIITFGEKSRRRPPKRTDDLLRYTRVVRLTGYAAEKRGRAP